jgi:hypothetical protein
VQVVVWSKFGDPFKAWVAGSNPAALTSLEVLRLGLRISPAGSRSAHARKTAQVPILPRSSRFQLVVLANRRPGASTNVTDIGDAWHGIAFFC